MTIRTSKIEQKRCSSPNSIVEIALDVEVQQNNVGNDTKNLDKYCKIALIVLRYGYNKITIVFPMSMLVGKPFEFVTGENQVVPWLMLYFGAD